MRKNRLTEYFNSELMTILFIPVTTILVSLVCFTLTTWAWYTATIDKGVSSVKTTVDLSVDVCKVDGDNCNTVDALQDGTFSLASNATYKITYVPGYAENGYYSVLNFKSEENTVTEKYVTPLIKKSDSSFFTYEILANQATKLIIITKWAKTGSVYETEDSEVSVLNVNNTVHIGEPVSDEPTVLSEDIESIEGTPIQENGTKQNNNQLSSEEASEQQLFIEQNQGFDEQATEDEMKSDNTEALNVEEPFQEITENNSEPNQLSSESNEEQNSLNEQEGLGDVDESDTEETGE